MPWCGYWGASSAAYWWVLPLIGLAFLGLMFFVCWRGSGCMMRRSRPSGGGADLQREVETLKAEVRKLARQPK